MSDGIKKKAVIFDCDGVLVDSEPLSNSILAQEATKYGWPMTRDESIAQFKGGKMSVIKEEIADRTGRKLPDDWIEHYYAQVLELFRWDLKPVDGALQLVDWLSAEGVPFCVASQGSVGKMEVSLGVTGLWNRFEGRVFSANMVPRPKPAPDLFLHAARSLEKPVEDCVVIEDSRFGIQAAKSAGIFAIGYAANDDDRDILAQAGADRIIHHLSEAASLIQP